MDRVDSAVAELSQQYPSLEALVSAHDNLRVARDGKDDLMASSARPH